MAAVVKLPYTLPKASSSTKEGSEGSLSSPKADATLLAAGPSYIAQTRRQLNQLTFDDDDAAEEARQAELNNGALNGDDVDLPPEEDEPKELLNRDPQEWKVSTANFVQLIA